MQKNLTYFFVLLGMLTMSMHGNAEWNTCLLEEHAPTSAPKPAFLTLKMDVKHYLEGRWCSPEKADLLMDLIYHTRPQVCVEIGAYNGGTVLPVAATLQYLGHGRIFAVEAWSNEEAIKFLQINDTNYSWWSLLDMRRIRREFEKLKSDWELSAYCTVIPAPSEYAVHAIPEIDFLHLDGNIAEEGALLDLELYLPKVTPGGYILISNLFVVVDNKISKMSSMWKLFDQCELICEIDNGNAALFRKNFSF